MDSLFKLGNKIFRIYDIVDDDSIMIHIFEQDKVRQDAELTQTVKQNFGKTLQLISKLMRKDKGSCTVSCKYEVQNWFNFQPQEWGYCLKHIDIDMLKMIAKWQEPDQMKVSIYEVIKGDFKYYFIVRTGSFGVVNVSVVDNKMCALGEMLECAGSKPMKCVESDLERLALESFFEMQVMSDTALKDIFYLFT